MRQTIYAFGIATFLAMFIFTIVTSLTNPFYGMSEAALAQTSTNCNFSNSSAPPPFASTGISYHENCLRGYCIVYVEVKYAKFIINGQVIWKLVVPDMDLSGAIEFKTETQHTNVEVWGSQYTCDQTTNKNCWVAFCY